MKTISTELISYQNADIFPEKLTEKIESIFKEINCGLYLDNKTIIEKSSYLKEIEELIKDRFNMNVVFDKELHFLYPAAIIPFFNDYIKDFSNLKSLGAVLISKLFKFENTVKHINQITKERKDILAKLHNKKGYIDLRNARVGGYLSDVKHFLIIDFFTLKNLGLIPSEIAAVILHELGHAFTGLEYHHKLETTNSTISDVLNEINNNNPDKAVYIFKKHFTNKEFQDMAVNTKEEIYDFYGKVAILYLNEIKTQLVNNKYDETNFENLADSFSSRFNVGKDLVSGLNKLHIKYGNVKGNIAYGTLTFFEIMMAVMVLVLFGPIGVAISATLILTIYNIENTAMTYDIPLDRYNRVKNSIINNLKDINLPIKLTQELIDQHVFINNVIENSLYFKPIVGRISDIILSSNRNSLYYIDLQKKIENGLNNTLFLRAQQIRTN